MFSQNLLQYTGNFLPRTESAGARLARLGTAL